jgi:hypothetical protein
VAFQIFQSVGKMLISPGPTSKLGFAIRFATAGVPLNPEMAAKRTIEFLNAPDDRVRTAPIALALSWQAIA